MGIRVLRDEDRRPGQEGWVIDRDGTIRVLTSAQGVDEVTAAALTAVCQRSSELDLEDRLDDDVVVECVSCPVMPAGVQARLRINRRRLLVTVAETRTDPRSVAALAGVFAQLWALRSPGVASAA